MISEIITSQTYSGPKTTSDTIDIPFHDGSSNAQFIEDTEILVIHIANDGVTETTLTVGVEYQLNKTQNGGLGLALPTGQYVSDEVEILTASLVAADEDIRIERDTAKTQEQTFTDKTLELALDKLTVICQEVETSVNNSPLDARVTANEANIATNVIDIASNVTNISSNDVDIAANVSDIADNTSNISTNITDISTNESDIAAIEADIGIPPAWGGNTMSEQINANKIAIGALSYDAVQVAANTVQIATNVADIATNVADIATNNADIATNVIAIAANGSRIDQLEADFGNDYRLAGSQGIANTGAGWLDITALKFNGSASSSIYIHYEIERRTENPAGIVEINNGILRILYVYNPSTDTFSWQAERNAYDGTLDTLEFQMTSTVALEATLQYNAAIITGANYYGKFKYQAYVMAAGL